MPPRSAWTPDPQAPPPGSASHLRDRGAPATLAAVLLLAALLTPAAASTAASTCVIPPEGIVAWWPLDEQSGTLSQERIKSQDGRHVNGPTPVQGLVDGALSFDGFDDYVVVPDSPDWELGSGDFTMELWMSLSRPPRGSQGHPGDVFFSHDEGPFNVPKYFFSLSSTHLQFHVNGPGIGPVFSPLATFAPEVGRWYHLAVTRSGTDYRIYVDGRLEAEGANAADIPDVDSLLTFGRALEPFGGFFAGRLDEITLYDRALTEAEIRAIFEAGAAGKCKQVIIRTRALSGLQLSLPASQELQAVGGAAPYRWTVLEGAQPPGMRLEPNGVFHGRPTRLGTFAFTLGVEDASGATDSAQYAVDVSLTPPEPEIRIHKVGLTAVPGRTLDYFLEVENRGSTTVSDLPVVEVLDPDRFSLVAASPPPLLDPGLSAPLSNVVWRIADLEPGETQVLEYSAVLDASTPLGDEVASGPACVGQAALDALFACLPEAVTAGIECEDCRTPCRALSLCSLGPEVCVVPLTLCTFCMVHPDVAGLSGCVPGVFEAFQCFRDRLAQLRKACAEDRQTAVGPVDPNEKLVLAPRFIQPDQDLVYPIHFENVGDAEALDVFVKDHLDPGLDLSTVELLTPGGVLDGETRTIHWDLRGRDLQPGETGNVVFRVRPLAGLPSATEIHNRASVRFEVFEPLVTPEVVNVIDTTPPECHVEALPDPVFTDDFEVRWQGSDEVGEIESFSVFVTDDGGESFHLFHEGTDTRAIFEGHLGDSYGFFCVAKDTAGNTESQALVSEATTRVARAAIDIKPDSTDNEVNPGSRGVVPVALLGSELVDVRRVDPESLAFGPGKAHLAHRHGPHVEDVNGDGYPDLVAHFRIADTGIAAGATEACLDGELGGAGFEACDSLTTVPAH